MKNGQCKSDHDLRIVLSSRGVRGHLFELFLLSALESGRLVARFSDLGKHSGG